MSRPRVVIAGGGTAGHVVPAIAIANALVARGTAREQVHLYGSRRGIDSRLAGLHGFPLTLLPGRGIARSLALSNLASIAGLAAAFVIALARLLRGRPKVVVSMGGYAAAPTALAAWALRIPVVISEQNAVPTATHRLVARFARSSAVPVAGTPLPNPVVTGNPVRPEVLAVDGSDEGRRAARQSLGIDAGATVILATGGSLGSRTINRAVCGLAAAWASRSGVWIRHVVGERDWAEIEAAAPLPEEGGLRYERVRYEDRMPEAMAAADLIVSRAGGTVWEMAIIGRGGILVPLPIAPFDHQAANARPFVEAGAAVMLRDHEVTAERLAQELDRILEAPGRPRAMGEAARSLGHPDAADRVAALVEEYAR